MTRSRRTIFAFAAAIGLVVSAAACGTNQASATSSDMCGFTVGTGHDADALVHDVYLPGETIDKDAKEDIKFFPCNPRNIRLTPTSSDKDAKGNPVTSVTAYTKTGTKVIVDIRMDWTLNQDRDLLKNTFVPLCEKYKCATGDANVRNDNFSTAGWSNGVLGENATPAFITSTVRSVKAMDDTVWTDPEQQPILSEKVAADFMSSFRRTMGSTKDLFCGSGESSGWTNPEGDKDGKGTFKCSTVRITIEGIRPADTALLEIQAREAKAAKEKAANTKELDAAKEKYGPYAEQILGDLDRIEACAKNSKECTVIVGTSQNGVTVK